MLPNRSDFEKGFINIPYNSKTLYSMIVFTQTDKFFLSDSIENLCTVVGLKRETFDNGCKFLLENNLVKELYFYKRKGYYVNNSNIWYNKNNFKINIPYSFFFSKKWRILKYSEKLLLLHIIYHDYFYKEQQHILKMDAKQLTTTFNFSKKTLGRSINKLVQNKCISSYIDRNYKYHLMLTESFRKKVQYG